MYNKNPFIYFSLLKFYPITTIIKKYIYHVTYDDANKRVGRTPLKKHLLYLWSNKYISIRTPTPGNV